MSSSSISLSPSVKLEIQLTLSSNYTDNHATPSSAYSTAASPTTDSVGSVTTYCDAEAGDNGIDPYDEEDDWIPSPLPPNHRDVLVWRVLRGGRAITDECISEAYRVLDSIDPLTESALLPFCEDQWVEDSTVKDGLEQIPNFDHEAKAVPEDDEQEVEEDSGPEDDEGYESEEDVDERAEAAWESPNDLLLWDYIPRGPVTMDAIHVANQRLEIAKENNLVGELKYCWQFPRDPTPTAATAAFKADRTLPVFVDGRHTSIRRAGPIGAYVGGEYMQFHLVNHNDISQGAFINGKLATVSVPPDFVIEQYSQKTAADEESKWLEMSRRLEAEELEEEDKLECW